MYQSKGGNNMAKIQAISADEKRWRTQNDAEAIKRYHEIMGDKQRSKDAMGVVKKEADALNKAIKNIKK